MPSSILFAPDLTPTALAPISPRTISGTSRSSCSLALLAEGGETVIADEGHGLTPGPTLLR
jgi:hypothetical protein